MATIKQRLDWAQKNQDNPAAQALISRYKSGKLNHELKQAGMKPIDVKPKIDTSRVDLSKVMGNQLPVQGGGDAFNPKTGIQAGATPLQSRIPESKENEFAKFGERLSETVTERQSDQARIAERGEQGEISKGQELFQRAGQAVGGAFELAGETALGLAEIAAPKWLEDKVAGVAKSTGEEVVDYTKRFMQELREGDADEQQVAAKVDEAVELYKNDETFRDDVRAAGGILEALAAATGAGPAKQALKQSVDTVKDTSKSLAPIVREGAEALAERTGEATTATAGFVGRQGDRVFRTTQEQAEQQIEDSVRRIVQAKSPDDIAAAKEGLKQVSINPENIKSYNDLHNTLGGHIEATAKAVDDELAQYTEKFTPEQLAKYEKVGDRTVATTPVHDALNGLQEAYTKSGEAAKAEAVRQLREKLDTEGLTVLELNQLAREYGIEFKDRAFDKMGNVKSGYNAENFENVRSSLKDVVRERLPDNYAKELDTKLSNLYRTNDLIEDMRDKVFQRVNKMPRKTLGSTVAGIAVGAAEIADILTMRIASSLFQQMVRKSNIAQKQYLNPVEMEAALNKELQKISKLMQIEDTPTFETRFQEYLNNMQIGMSVKPIHADDNSFFSELADTAYTITDKDMKIAQDTLRQYDLHVPKNKEGMKVFLRELTEGIFDQKMDESLQRGSLLPEDMPTTP